MKKIVLTSETKKSIFFYVLLFMLCLSITLMHTNYDYDLWARFIVGKSIFQTGQVFKYDFLAYTPTHIWYDHEWGASVFFYVVENYFGHLGIVFFQAFFFFFIMVFIIKTVKLRCGAELNYRNAVIFFVTLNLITATYGSMIRCHWFSFLFFSIELYLLELYRKTENKKFLYVMPFLFLFWGNIHGGVASGAGLLFMYTVGQFLNKKPFKTLLLISVISPLMIFINPYGPDYVKFLLDAVTMPRKDIVEWVSIFTYSHSQILLKLTIIFCFIIEIVKFFKNPINYSTIDKTKVIVLLVTTYSSASHIKLVPFFGIVATVFCYQDLYVVFKNVKFPGLFMSFLNLVLFLYAVGMLSMGDYTPVVDKFGYPHYPYMEVEFIKQNRLEGKLFVNFGYGSFVGYKLYPQNRVYIDGRYEEVFNEDLMVDMSNFYKGADKMYDLFNKNRPDIIILDNGYTALLEHLIYSGEWIDAFSGPTAHVLLSPKYANRKIHFPSTDLGYYKKTILNTDITFKGENKIDVNAVNRGELTTVIPYKMRMTNGRK